MAYFIHLKLKSEPVCLTPGYKLSLFVQSISTKSKLHTPDLLVNQLHLVHLWPKKPNAILKHVHQGYITVLLMRLAILVLICHVVLYFHDSSEKLAVVCRSDVTLIVSTFTTELETFSNLRVFM